MQVILAMPLARVREDHGKAPKHGGWGVPAAYKGPLMATAEQKSNLKYSKGCRFTPMPGTVSAFKFKITLEYGLL